MIPAEIGAQRDLRRRRRKIIRKAEPDFFQRTHACGALALSAPTCPELQIELKHDLYAARCLLRLTQETNSRVSRKLADRECYSMKVH